MSSPQNDNFNHLHNKFDDLRQGPYSSVADVLLRLHWWQRREGLKVYIAGDGWYMFEADLVTLVPMVPQAAGVPEAPDTADVYVRGSLSWIAGVTKAVFESFTAFVDNTYLKLTDFFVPTPVGQPDGKVLKTAAGALVYADESGGGGGGPTTNPYTPTTTIFYPDGKPLRTLNDQGGGKYVETRLKYYTTGVNIGRLDFMEVKDDVLGSFVRITANYDTGFETSITVIIEFTIPIS